MRRVYTPGACVATSSSDYFRSGERRYFAEDTGREIDENAEFSFKFSSAVRRAFFFFFHRLYVLQAWSDASSTSA